jgi:hypothetical protein
MRIYDAVDVNVSQPLRIHGCPPMLGKIAEVRVNVRCGESGQLGINSACRGELWFLVYRRMLARGDRE